MIKWTTLIYEMAQLLNLNTYLSAKLIAYEQSVFDFNNSNNLIIHQAHVG
jgi:hypothetical protein